MEYNTYYPVQPGNPQGHSMGPGQHGPPPHMQPQPPLPAAVHIMHAPIPPPPVAASPHVRQSPMPMNPGLSNHIQQQQQQQMTTQPPHLGHHLQPMPGQQVQQQQQQQQQQPQVPAQHLNYHQIQPASHPHQLSTPSPHPQQQSTPQPMNHNHQAAIVPGPSPHQNIMTPPVTHQHQHTIQSPHGTPPISHIPHTPPQQMNQMVRPSMGATVISHPSHATTTMHQQQQQPQQPPGPHQNFFNGTPAPQSNFQHPYAPQSNPVPHPPVLQQPQHQTPPLMQPSPTTMGGPLPPQNFQAPVGRNSPYHPNILQTEFRVLELNRRLQCRPISRQPVSPLSTSNYDDSLWWERFASEFFEDDATLSIRIQDDKSVDYTIGRTLIPRFFRTYFDGGVTDLSINLRNPKERYIHPQLITLDCDQASIITNNIYRHPAMPTNQGDVVHTEGHLILDFTNTSYDTLSIKSWKFYTKACREYIDRSITAVGLPNSYLVEPSTRQGLTKSTITYLKMCMIMEPMLDLMAQHRQTKMDPRSCLKKLLFDRYKYRTVEDTRAPANKRRKRKTAATSITGSTTTKKSKSNNVDNNSIVNNGLNSNNVIMSSSSAPAFPATVQDVMIVGEPSMMGGDFGDDNQRMITRLENSQFDPSSNSAVPVNSEEPMNRSTPTTNENGLGNTIETGLENHTLSPSLFIVT